MLVRPTFCISACVALVGCAAAPKPGVPTVSQAWGTKSAATAPSGDISSSIETANGGIAVGAAPSAADAVVSSQPGVRSRPLAASAQSIGPILATVNGRPIEREAVVDLLIRSRGAEVLEGLVVLEAAMKLAADRHVVVSGADVAYEYDQALRQLADPSAAFMSAGFDRPQAEKLLDTVLAERHVSRDEFMVGMKRNAYLRKLAAGEVAVSEEEVLAEFERERGERARIRHIQAASPSSLATVQEALARGEDFADLASRFSANVTTAARGGALDPFTRDSEDVPMVFREAAFSMKAGQVSRPIRVGQWYHLIQLEAILPAREVELSAVRGDLERRLRDRAAGPVMEALYGKLLRQARVEIDDPALKAAFHKRLSERL